MNILILTTSNPYKAAGIVALDLKKALNIKAEHQVKILTRSFDKYADDSIQCIHTMSEEYFYWVINLLQRIVYKTMRILFNHSLSTKTDPNYYIQGADLTKDYYSTKKFIKKINTFRPDAIIVLFMPYFLTFKNLYELNKATKAPILLYLMDMAPMTGGCHYAWDCKGYYNACGRCPAMFSGVENDQSRKNWEYKKYYVDKTELTIIAGTEYQFRQLQKSSLFAQKQIAKVLLSVNPEIFKPGNKLEARKVFNLPVKKKIILFGAVYPGSKRKGFNELIETLHLLKNMAPDLELHLAIAGYPDKQLTINLPYGYTLLGYLGLEKLATAFQAADLFLCSSIEDSGPMMINQAIMCGIPVVAFDMGVALDLVITGETGYIAKKGDINDLAEGVNKVLALTESNFEDVNKKCRNLGLYLCSPEAQANMIFYLLNNNKHI
ncbi:MAG TPA: glycosyltransferase [Bacteroidales bacterium]|nr:glycosyltransferase [Bacteroidales bacterium]